MRFSIWRKAAALAAGLALVCVAADAPSKAQAPALPKPVLVLTSIEPFKNAGKDWTRYRYAVDNSSAYPDALFAASPELPPCGNNKKASRTWVDLYDQTGKRLNGFCALGKAADLKQIWFALESNVIPPSWVYVELNDRATNTKYKSNLADTSQ